jgi:hypothetical protein
MPDAGLSLCAVEMRPMTHFSYPSLDDLTSSSDDEIDQIDLQRSYTHLYAIAYLGRRLLNTLRMFLLFYLSFCLVPRDIRTTMFSNQIESSWTSLHDTGTALEYT